MIEVRVNITGWGTTTRNQQIFLEFGMHVTRLAVRSRRGNPSGRHTEGTGRASEWDTAAFTAVPREWRLSHVRGRPQLRQHRVPRLTLYLSRPSSRYPEFGTQRISMTPLSQPSSRRGCAAEQRPRGTTSPIRACRQSPFRLVCRVFYIVPPGEWLCRVHTSATAGSY